MALTFKVEPLQDTVRFTAKGVAVELSYHAASALCNKIAEVIVSRNDANSNMHRYWMEKLRKKGRVNVRPNNREKYENFLNGMEQKPQDASLTIPAESVERVERCHPPKPIPDRRQAQQQKIEELQKRFGISPKRK